jgi:hypothetical protein
VSLPAPEFDPGAAGSFRVILRQDAFTEKRLKDLGFNERQIRAVAHVRQHW